MIAGAIIAGGAARRLGGRDKSRIVVEGASIIVRQLTVLRSIADEIFIVVREAEQAGRFMDLGVPVHVDRLPGVGVLGAIDTALVATAADRVITIACDLPFLPRGLLALLAARAETADAAWVMTARGAEPLIACYRQSARAAIQRQIAAGLLAAHALSGVIRIARVGLDDVRAFGPADRILANINTPEDLARVATARLDR
jgi:molybdopterin-guanine dinucleotide biosynthesis protein A